MLDSARLFYSGGTWCSIGPFLPFNPRPNVRHEHPTLRPRRKGSPWAPGTGRCLGRCGHWSGLVTDCAQGHSAPGSRRSICRPLPSQSSPSRRARIRPGAHRHLPQSRPCRRRRDGQYPWRRHRPELRSLSRSSGLSRSFSNLFVPLPRHESEHDGPCEKATALSGVWSLPP